MTKIAIIEDDQAISQMYRIKFETEGYEVEIAENGKLGLELVENFRPDIILLDLMMPEMSGDEMLAKLRQTDFGRDVRVIILTNIGESEVNSNINNLGISGLIVKANLKPSQVLEKVKETLG